MPYAAPGGAAPSNNFIINGDMRVAQSAVYGTVGAETFNGANVVSWNTADMFAYQATMGTPQNFDTGYDDDNPINLTRGGCVAATRVASLGLGVNDYFTIRTSIEGLIFAPLYAQSAVLNFYVKATTPGTYNVLLNNGGGVTVLSGDMFAARYTVFNANAWELKQIPISFPSTLTYPSPFNTSRQLAIFWPLYVGANLRNIPVASVGAWQASPGFSGWADVGTGNAIGVDNAGSFKIAEVSLTVGSVGSGALQSYEQALAACLRYYWNTFPYGVSPRQNYGSSEGALHYRAALNGVANSGLYVPFPVPMRSTPTATFYNPVAANALWRNTSGGADSGAAAMTAAGGFANLKNAFVENPQAAGDAGGDDLYVHASFDARI